MINALEGNAATSCLAEIDTLLRRAARILSLATGQGAGVKIAVNTELPTLD